MSCLLVATLLGVGIGVCVSHLRAAERARKLSERTERNGRSRRLALDAALAKERERSAASHEEATRQIARERAKADRAVALQEALAERVKEQLELVASLQAKVRTGVTHGSGSGSGSGSGPVKHSAVQRAPSGGSVAGGVPRGALASVEARREALPDDLHLPVLNRRVESPGRVRPGASRPVSYSADFPIGGDLDIPALAESEVPDGEGDTVLDMLDSDRASRDADGH